MKIAITGATGFIGQHLAKIFHAKGWEVLPIGRKQLALPDQKLADLMDGVDAVINLAGATIARRWSEEYKKLIYNSRIDVTRKIVAAITLGKVRPRIFISTSAVGIYDGKEQHNENSTKFAEDYLGSVCKDWESEAVKAREFGVRTVICRFGIVLGKGGGMLSKMLPSFKLGLGGTIGNGRQFLSWIHLEDLGAAFCQILLRSNVKDIYNLTAPNPVTNKELTKTLANLLHRPALFPVPILVLKLIFLEGVVAIASGQFARPEGLLQEGFSFKFPTVQEALINILNE